MWLQDVVHDLALQVQQLQESVAKLCDRQDSLEELIENHGIWSQEVLDFQPNVYSEQDPIVRFIYFGCLGSNLTLSCSSGEIAIFDAFYGKYDEICVACCEIPNPYDDCRERVEENRPGDWEVLLETCEIQSSCVYDNRALL